MRIEITFNDRVGIAHEILALFAKQGLNLVAVEVDPPHIYIDSPDLNPSLFATLNSQCQHIQGVTRLQVIDVLPGMRRRLHLDTMMAAMQDPLLAIDTQGHIVVANAAALAITQLNDEVITSKRIEELFDDTGLLDELRSSRFHLNLREVQIQGDPYFLEVAPLTETHVLPEGQRPIVGALLSLHAPTRLGGRLHALQHAQAGFQHILGESEPIKSLKARAARVAVVDAPLLITGETGTGKEILAQACHAASPRAEAPILELNCAALPESLAESELFGYTAGAFTGAQRGGKPGLFELADGGSVFLDEIGEMSLYLQAKLLRFLNDGKFRRIGSDKEVKVNVRIISASHRNLAQMVKEGRFREDLYYRLNVLHLELPALRDRASDILLLARHFVERACTQAQKPVARLSAAASAALIAHPWPGNVRQLQNVIFRAVTLSDHAVLEVSDLDDAQGSFTPHSTAFNASERWDEAVARFESTLLANLYPQFPSSRKLAQRLGISHSVIAAKLRKYKIPSKP